MTFRKLSVESLQAFPPLESFPDILRDENEGVFLDSAHSSQGRYSFLGLDPYWRIDSKNGQTRSGPPNGPFSNPKNVFDEIRRCLGPKQPAHSIPFCQGAIGYLGYELLHQLESVPKNPIDDFAVPDLCLFFFSTVWVFDALENRFWLSLTADNDEALKMLRTKNLNRFNTLRRSPARQSANKALALRKAHERFSESLFSDFKLQPVTTKAQYLDIVHRAKEHIFAGDIFEVCTAQRFDSSINASGEALYSILREVSPAPFSALMKFDNLHIASSSPERFMQLSAEGRAQTRPIKGTRPRSADASKDAAWANELAHSEKDLAENMMIVDLCRNDLGRVCRFGTVQVPQLQKVESHAFTHQMVSTIEGQLEEGLDAVDLLKAAFPGGSITGAPKIEAMKIISALEPVKRGVFCGSLGFLSTDGSMDFSIAIRTLVKKQNRVCFHVGGAVTADSIPEEEYQETLDKAFGMAIALKLATEEAP